MPKTEYAVKINYVCDANFTQEHAFITLKISYLRESTTAWLKYL